MSESEFKLTRPDGGKTITVTDGLVAGRLAESGLVLSEGHPSRKHASFRIDNGKVFVEDLQSSNGTFVNGQRIAAPTALNDGDEVRFDVETYRFSAPGGSDDEKTVLRGPESKVVKASSRERPAWIDPNQQAAGGPKTEFIGAAEMKELMNEPGSPNLADAHDVETPALIVTSGEKANSRFELFSDSDQGTWTIGSQSDRDIRIADDGVSGVHAKLTQEGRRWKLSDQMSQNGTFVNGKKSNMSYLNNGDRLRFGPIECVFRTPESFGTATRISKAPPKTSKNRNLVIGIVAFVVTLAVAWFVLTRM
jgi:pSer/pThr/pTyr-binding forkhead associated (FHA) protein